jgi:hypothetical protein
LNVPSGLKKYESSCTDPPLKPAKSFFERLEALPKSE